MEDFYLIVKMKLDGMEVMKKFTKKENLALLRNVILLITLKLNKDVYSLLIGWKPLEIQLMNIRKFPVQMSLNLNIK